MLELGTLAVSHTIQDAVASVDLWSGLNTKGVVFTLMSVFVLAASGRCRVNDGWFASQAEDGEREPVICPTPGHCSLTVDVLFAAMVRF